MGGYRGDVVRVVQLGRPGRGDQSGLHDRRLGPAPETAVDQHPDPASVLQSWLDSPAADEHFSRSEVYRAVVASRHRTLEHLLQIPADEILSRHEPEIALKILLGHCGRSTKRWAALAVAMTFAYDEEQISLESSSTPWTTRPRNLRLSATLACAGAVPGPGPNSLPSSCRSRPRGEQVTRTTTEQR